MAGGLGGLGGSRPELTPLTGEELLQLAVQRGGPSLEAYHPTIRDRIGNAVYDAVGGLGGLGGVPNRMRNDALSVIDMVPGIGAVLAADDAGRSFENGDYLNSLISAGMAVIPGVGGAAGKAGKKLARGVFEMDYFGQPVRIMQNPSPQQLKGFLNRTKHKAARRIHDPASGEAYVWDAGDPALHQLVAERLGIPVDDKLIMDMIGLD